MFIDDSKLKLCGQKLDFHDVFKIQTLVKNKKIGGAASTANFTSRLKMKDKT